MSPTLNTLRRGCLLALALSNATSAFAATAIRFRDATPSTGIQFEHTDGRSGQRHIIETVASGLGLIDYNGDGFPDILFLNGAPLPGSLKLARLPTSALYRNNQDGTFTDVTTSSGMGVSAYALGCAVADYDNDGHEDILITGYERHHLWHNNGDGTFSEVTDHAGLAQAAGPGWVGAGCLFLDYDRDGYVDLFVGNYLQFDSATARPWTQAGVPVYCNPRTFAAVPSRLYHNNRDGTFRDVSDSSGIGSHKGYAMGVVSADFDGDGWPDIYVGNDVMENFLLHNRRHGTFEEIGVLAGVGYDQYGDPQGTMGANVGDFDGDGRFDILVTKYQNQVNTLYRNLGQMQFQDVTVETGAGVASRSLVTWGCGLVDFDNDGVPEIFTAAGHLQDTAAQPLAPAAGRALPGRHRRNRQTPRRTAGQPRSGLRRSRQRRETRHRPFQRAVDTDRADESKRHPQSLDHTQAGWHSEQPLRHRRLGSAYGRRTNPSR
jgi:enediyne biosynthesis protein E4